MITTLNVKGFFLLKHSVALKKTIFVIISYIFRASFSHMVVERIADDVSSSRLIIGDKILTSNAATALAYTLPRRSFCHHNLHMIIVLCYLFRFESDSKQKSNIFYTLV